MNIPRIVVVVLCLSVGACAQLPKIQAIAGGTVTQSQVDGVRSGYDGAFLAPLRRYALLPKCTQGQRPFVDNCHDAETLKRLRSVDAGVAKDFNDIQSAMSGGSVSAMQVAWTTLNNAVASAKATVTDLGLQ